MRINDYFHDYRMKAFFLHISNDQRQANKLVLFTLTLLSFLFFWPSMQQFPAFVHAWTQTDRLAISLCFQQNGFDFFHPCNFNLITKEGITAVDFPILEYAVALFSYLFNANPIFIFRLFNLTIGIIGIYHIYKLFTLISKQIGKGIFMAFFTITLPFFAYYLNGFLPSSTAFSFLFIGLYYWVTYLENEKHKFLLIASVFTALAALIRLPFIIPLFAILGVWFINAIRQKKIVLRPIIGLSIGAILVVAYWFYNHYLASIYGNIFLSKLLSINSLQELINTLSEMIERWSNEYFTPYHYVLLIATIYLFISAIKQSTNRSAGESFLRLFLCINSIGVVLFFIAMGKQFIDHDYYFLDTFLPLIIVFVGVAIAPVKISQVYSKVIYSLLLIGGIGSIGYTKSALVNRYKIDPSNRTQIAYNAYLDGAKLVEKHQIAKDATFLALDAYTTNGPFIVLERKGVAILNTDSTNIKNGLDLNLDYTTLLDTFLFSDVYQNYPDIIFALDYIDQTKKLRLYQPTENPEAINFFNQLYHYSFLDFSVDSGSIYDGYSNHTNRNGESLQLNENTAYGLTYSQQLTTQNSEFPIDVVVDVDVLLPDSTTTTTLVVAVDNQFYQPYYLENEIDSIAEWNHLHLRTQLPLNISGELKVYLWNPDRKTLDYDNFRLLIAQ